MATPREAPHGRRRKKQRGNRLNRTQLAARLKLDRKTVAKYLALDGAPKPDRAVRYDVEACRSWFEKVMPRLPSTSEEHKELSLAIKRLEREDLELDLKAKRGELVEKKLIEPTIAAAMTLLTEALRGKFELELPAKYEGKTTAERMKLNADGVDQVLQQFAAGLSSLR